MAKLQQEFKARGFQAIGIALDPDTAAVEPFRNATDFRFRWGTWIKSQPSNSST